MYRYKHKRNPRNPRVIHSSITKGLYACVFPSANTGTPKNLITHNQITATTPSAEWDVSSYGKSYRLTSTGSNGLDISNPSTGATGRTFMICHMPVAAQTDNVLLEQGTNTTGNRVTMRSLTGGALRVDIEGSGTTSALTALPNVFNVSGFKVTSSTTVRIFLNGAFENSGTLGTINTTGSTMGMLYPALSAGAGVSLLDHVYWIMYWTRSLRDDEMLSIYKNPWQVLMPIEYGSAIQGGVGIGFIGQWGGINSGLINGGLINRGLIH